MHVSSPNCTTRHLNDGLLAVFVGLCDQIGCALEADRPRLVDGRQYDLRVATKSMTARRSLMAAPCHCTGVPPFEAQKCPENEQSNADWHLCGFPGCALCHLQQLIFGDRALLLRPDDAHHLPPGCRLACSALECTQARLRCDGGRATAQRAGHAPHRGSTTAGYQVQPLMRCCAMGWQVDGGYAYLQHASSIHRNADYAHGSGSSITMQHVQQSISSALHGH